MEIILKAFTDKGEIVSERHYTRLTYDSLTQKIKMLEVTRGVVRVTVDMAFMAEPKTTWPKQQSRESWSE